MKYYNEMWSVKLQVPSTSRYNGEMNFTSFAKAWEAYTYYHDNTAFACELWDVSDRSAEHPWRAPDAAPSLRIA